MSLGPLTSVPVWPRPVYACMVPGCRYVESALGRVPGIVCPAHGVTLISFNVAPVIP